MKEQKLRPFSPVKKLQWLRGNASLSNLGRAELAVLIVMADMANADSGICWPSYNTIADAAGVTTRHAKRAIKKLVDKGLIEVAEAGNRVRSNRYRIKLNLIASDPYVTTVVTPVSSCSDTQGQHVVTPMSPESIHSSEHKASDEWDRYGAAALRLDEPTLARQNNNKGERFKEFWEAVGYRATVHESEQEIAELIQQGYEYELIIAGATRWREYNQVTGGKRKASPVNWLKSKKFLDDWTPPDVSKKLTSGNTGKSKKALGKQGKPRRRKNPDFASWQAQDKKLYNAAYGNEDIRQHMKTCSTCKAGKPADPKSCAKLGVIVESSNQARTYYESWRNENPMPDRWLE